ncbi:MAG: VWA domain-containing protein [bacterium]|nr:VWA domain-containing protein [bacterium]
MNYSLTLTHSLIAGLVFLSLAIWTIYAYSRSLPPQTPPVRMTLTALRLAASLLLSLMVGGIGLAGRGQEEVKPRLHILIDTSASMSRLDADTADNRFDRARMIQAAAVERWEDRLTVDLRPFGITPLGRELPVDAMSPGTDIAAALAAVPPTGAENYVMLLSDGRDTEGNLWGGSIDAGPPIFSILVGDSLPPADLRIEALDALPVLHKGGRLPLTVTVAAQGEAPRSGKLTLREGDNTILEQQWALPPGVNTLQVEAPFALEETGRHFIEVEVSGTGPDAAPENNRRLLSLRVVEGTLRILVLGGLPDWDLSSLMHSLRGEEFLEFDLVSAGENGAMRLADDGSPWSPTGEDYHGLLLHSLHPDWPVDILEQVQVRGGTLVLGNYLLDMNRARGLPGWNLSPDRGTYQRRECPIGWGRDASRHPAVQGVLAVGLQPDNLAPLETGFASPLRGGRELMHADCGSILRVAELGGRRLAVFSGRGFWRWGLRDGDGGLFQAELFSGLLRWLAREDPPDRLTVNWDAESLQAGLPGVLSAELFDADFEPSPGARLDWTLRHNDDLTAVGEFTEEVGPGHYRADLPALPEGVYALVVRAQNAAGEELRRELDLPVTPPDREILYPAADAATMRWLAARSGGLFLGGDSGSIRSAGFEAIEERIDFTPTYLARSSAWKLWQHPLLFLLLLALLGIEWGLRKRFSMI